MKRFDIEQFLFDNLENPKHSKSRKGADEVSANCPRCGKRKFYANAESGRFVCFACDFSGRSVVALVAELHDMSWSDASAFVFRQSVELRRRETMFSLKERIRALRPDAAKEDDDEIYIDAPLPKEFRPVWSKKKGWDLPTYLKKKRKIKSYTAKAWGMGYCTQGDYRYRLVIPFECPNGRAWTARDMTDSAKQKYMNPEADTTRLVIGWNMTSLTGDLVICEGPLDAVKLWQHEIPALALAGKVLHDSQLNMLAAHVPASTAVTVMLDPEEEEAPHTVAARLSSYFDQVFLAKLPLGVDPGSSTRDQANEAIERAVRWKGGAAVKARLAASRAKSYLDKRWV